MILITYNNDGFGSTSTIKNVWDVKADDPERLYKEFMINKSEKEFGIYINPHWLNIMNHENHHPELTELEYIEKSKLWKKHLRQWNIDKFISEILKGNKLNFKESGL